MSGSLDKKPRQICKVEELAGNNAPDIEGEINNKLAEGWIYQNTIVIGNKIYLVFIK
jgi:hypothetical protein